jgi:hypothetical protein
MGSWDWEKTVTDITTSLADIFRMKYASEYAKEMAPTVTETYQKTILPTLLIIGLIAIMVIKKW